MLSKIERPTGHERLAKVSTFLRDLDRPLIMGSWRHCAIGCAIRECEGIRAAGLTTSDYGVPIDDGGKTGMPAVMGFFEIDPNTAEHLFGGAPHNPPSCESSVVADKIDAFLDKAALNVDQHELELA